MAIGTPELVDGRYRIERRLGSGGMATVFLAHDERLDRRVALKRLHSDSPEDVGRRFRREAKVGASLNHPNVVAVYDTVTDDEGVLIVMEYVAGHTLRDEIAAGPLAPERAIEVLAGVAAALDHAHEHGVIHRDVKPANVLIADRGGIVKLADLGIASAAEHTKITKSGTVLGTAAYMAPERIEGDAGGPPADVYALAAVAYEALTGAKPFTGSSPMEIARRIATQEPPDLRDLRPDAPRATADVLKRGLAKDPGDRPPTARALVGELAAAYAEQAAPPPPPPATVPTSALARPARPRPAVLLAAALVLAAIIAGAVALLAGGGASSTRHAASTKTPAHKHRAHHRKRAPSPAAAPAPPSNGGSAAATPQDAVTAFYTRAAQKDFAGAWALGTDRLHSQLISLSSFQAQEQSLQSISFPQLTVTSKSANAATVSFRSIAHHTDRTDNCQGQIATARGSGGWLVDHLDAVNCAHQPAGPAAAPPAPAAKPQGTPGNGPKKPKDKGKGRGHGGGGGD